MVSLPISTKLQNDSSDEKKKRMIPNSLGIQYTSMILTIVDGSKKNNQLGMMLTLG